LGIIPTLSPYLSPLFLQDMSEAHPRLKVSIYEMKTLDILRGLTDRKIQAGIVATPIQSSLNLTLSPLFYERFSIFTSAKSRHAKRKTIALTELRGEELWLLNEGNCLSDQVTSICALHKEAAQDAIHTYHTDSLDALRNFISHSDGLTIMPELSTMSVPSEDEDLIKRITGPAIGREISMIQIKGAATAHLTEIIANQIKAVLPSRMLKHNSLEIIDPNITA
jgi:LysR family hydrogen peroxide-inducible transcriptional activator